MDSAGTGRTPDSQGLSAPHHGHLQFLALAMADNPGPHSSTVNEEGAELCLDAGKAPRSAQSTDSGSATPALSLDQEPAGSLETSDSAQCGATSEQDSTPQQNGTATFPGKNLDEHDAVTPQSSHPENGTPASITRNQVRHL